MSDSTFGLEATRLHFQSGGCRIGIEAFEGDPETAKSALIVLHGAGGVNYGNGYIRQLASVFAGQGHSTYLVHYFDRTGHGYADDPTIYANFEKWLETVGDAVDFVQGRLDTSRDRIALFGYSLGGYLAVAYGTRDPSIVAVIELAGGIDRSFAEKARKLPPTLVIHGDADRRVLPERARELEQLLKDLNVPHEVRIYEGEGHVLSPAAGLDALGHGMAFLDRFLK